jgi:WD domain, G-beta repeat
VIMPTITKKIQPQWQGQLTDYITAVAWSPVAEQFAASAASGEVVSGDGQELVYLQTAHSYSIDCLGYSADGQWLAAGGQQGKLYIWTGQQLVTTLDYPRTWIDHLAWHPTLPLLAFSTGKKVQLWDAVQQKIINTLDFNRSTVADLAWRPQGDYLAVAGYQGAAVGPWQGGDESELLAVDTGIHALAWSRDGEYLAGATLDRQLVVARVTELEMPWVMRGFPTKIQQLAWAASDLVAISGNQAVWWHYEDEDWQSLPPTDESIIQLAVHARLPLLMAASAGVLTWTELETGQALQLSWPGCTALAWQISERWLVSGNAQGGLLVCKC